MSLTVLDLVKELGVQWTRQERERRLFPLCVQVQAQLAARHGPTYYTPHISQVPATYGEEAKEIIRAEFPAYCLGH